jgi:hypothetical protein
MSDSTSRYSSVEAFYQADERRRRSPELDFGVWWRAAGVVYRLTWVDATGELIAVQLTPARTIPFHVLEDELERVYLPRKWAERVELVAEQNPELVVGVFGVAVIGGEPDSVTVLGVVRERGVVERLLEGWGEVCGEPDSLAWVVERVRRSGLEAAT